MGVITYPYLPEGRDIKYVGMDNEFMWFAKEYARRHSLDKVMPNAAVIVMDVGDLHGIIAAGANGSEHHERHGCERVMLKCPTGVGYDRCEGCHPKNHGEVTALRDWAGSAESLRGTDLYLWGHWWCCEHCWTAMDAAGVRQVYLLEGSEVLFNRDSPRNVIGRQFSE